MPVLIGSRALQYWNPTLKLKGDETVYVKFYRWYQSYNGAEYDSWFFVKPCH